MTSFQTIEDVAAVQRLVTALDQEDEEVEIARDERQLEPVTDEKPSSRRHNEIAEVVAGHSGCRGRAIVSERFLQNLILRSPLFMLPA